jgi:signal transduction histidine kinase
MAARLSRELRVFDELARALARSPAHVGETLERICAEIQGAFGFERGMVVRYRPEDRTVHAVVQQGIDWPGDEWLAIDRFSFLVDALESRRAVHVADPRAEAAMPGKVIERFGVRSVVAVPLSVEARCLGFLVADRRGAAFQLGADELDLLTAFGSIAAVLVDRADQYAELQYALDELRRLDQLKSDFISIASHELRTPIAVVHGISSTLHLRGDELAPEQLQELRQALYDQSSRLVALADQLLDLSRIDAGALSFEPYAWPSIPSCRSSPTRTGSSGSWPT